MVDVVKPDKSIVDNDGNIAGEMVVKSWLDNPLSPLKSIISRSLLFIFGAKQL